MTHVLFWSLIRRDRGIFVLISGIDNKPTAVKNTIKLRPVLIDTFLII